MLVKELIELLETMDQDAEVITFPDESVDGFGYANPIVREGVAMLEGEKYRMLERPRMDNAPIRVVGIH